MTPPPHVAEQPPNDPHEPHSPSTEKSQCIMLWTSSKIVSKLFGNVLNAHCVSRNIELKGRQQQTLKKSFWYAFFYCYIICACIEKCISFIRLLYIRPENSNVLNYNLTRTCAMLVLTFPGFFQFCLAILSTMLWFWVCTSSCSCLRSHSTCLWAFAVWWPRGESSVYYESKINETIYI